MLKLFAKKKADPRQDLEEVLGDYELPTFPAIVMSVLEKVRQADSSLAEISDLVAADPGLTMQLLSTVNSAAFSLRHKVRSIHHAISLLGRSQLEAMLIGVAVRQTVPNGTARGFEPGRFWRAAARRAAAARALSDRIDPSTRSESFTASLLQDMALPILSHAKPSDYGPLLEQWHAEGGDLVALENQEHDWNHATVAKLMSESWNFPERLAQAIGGHHAHDGDDPADLPAVRLVSSLREGEDSPGVEELIERAHSMLGLDRDTLAELVRVSFEESKTLAANLS